jgi:hypothetical protein
MKDQSVSNLNLLTQSNAIYTNSFANYMKKFMDLAIKENAKFMEKSQARYLDIFQTKNAATAMQMASDHMGTTANDWVEFALKASTMGYQEHLAFINALQKQLIESSESLSSSIDHLPNGSLTNSALMLTAFKSALEMSNHLIDSSQVASKRTVELMNQSWNAASHQHNLIKDTKTLKKQEA